MDDERVHRIARELTAADVLQDAADAAFWIVDGMEGMISEHGEREIYRYWRRNILSQYDTGVRQGVNASFLADLLKGLIDGLEGVVSEQGGLDDSRYWRRDALRNAESALRALRSSREKDEFVKFKRRMF
jgi:hypothetical protein